MSSKPLQTPLRRAAKRRRSWMMAVVFVTSAVAMATLSVGFGLWLLLVLVDSQRTVVSHAAPKTEKVSTSPVGKVAKKDQARQKVSLDPIQASITPIRD